MPVIHRHPAPKLNLSLAIAALALAHLDACGAPPEGETSASAVSQRTATHLVDVGEHVAKQPLIGGYTSRPADLVPTSPIGWLAISDRNLHIRGLCTGTLIAPDVVLTAAHCLMPDKFDEKMDYYFSTTDMINQDSGQPAIGAAHLIPHPNFDPLAPNYQPLAWRRAETLNEVLTLLQVASVCSAKPDRILDAAYWQCLQQQDPALLVRLGMQDSAYAANDIGLVLLDEPIDHATPARLPDASQPAMRIGDIYTAAGYGVYEYTGRGARSGRLHFGAVRVDALHNAYEMQADFAHVQAGPGDSGGPLLQLARHGAPVIVGINTRALINAEGRPSGPGIYTQTAAFVPWIQRALQAACVDHQRTASMCQDFPF